MAGAVVAETRWRSISSSFARVFLLKRGSPHVKTLCIIVCYVSVFTACAVHRPSLPSDNRESKTMLHATSRCPSSAAAPRASRPWQCNAPRRSVCRAPRSAGMTPEQAAAMQQAMSDPAQMKAMQEAMQRPEVQQQMAEVRCFCVRACGLVCVRVVDGQRSRRSKPPAAAAAVAAAAQRAAPFLSSPHTKKP